MEPTKLKTTKKDESKDLKMNSKSIKIVAEQNEKSLKAKNEKERLEKEKLEKERVERLKKEKEKPEKERKEKDRIEKEGREKERPEKDQNKVKQNDLKKTKDVNKKDNTSDSTKGKKRPISSKDSKSPNDPPVEKKVKLSLQDYKNLHRKNVNATTTNKAIVDEEQTDLDLGDYYGNLLEDVTPQISQELKNRKSNMKSSNSFWSSNNEYGIFGGEETEYEKNLKKLKAVTEERKTPPLPGKQDDVKKKRTTPIESNPKAKIVEPPKPDEDLPISINFSSNVPTTIADLMATNPVKPKYSTVNATVPNQPDDISKYLNAKSKRSLLYTGKKDMSIAGKVPKLWELSVKVLVENIDDLAPRIYALNLKFKHRFPLAFDIIKPVLEKANAKQLEKIESYCPYFLEFSGNLWKELCAKEFKITRLEDDDETWRELFYRKHDEREEKFQLACSRVSSSQANRGKARQTLLAVDARPSRDIVRIQNKNGTTNVGIKAQIKAAFPVNQGSSRRSNASGFASSSGSSSLSANNRNRAKIKDAPKPALMAKTLRMMKNYAK